MIYIAAQVASIDLKIDLAITETMRVYKRILSTTASLAGLPMASTTNRGAAGVAITKAVLQCFGLPTLTNTLVWKIIKDVVWSEIGDNAFLVVAELLAASGTFGTAAMGIPFVLIGAAVNPALVVPGMTRLVLMLAADVILILTAAFHQTALTGIGQPLLKHVEAAAAKYRPTAARVHKEVLGVIRKRDLIKAFQYAVVNAELERIVYHYKNEAMEDKQDSRPMDIPKSGKRSLLSSLRSSSSRSIDTLISKDIEREVREELQDELKDLEDLTSAPPGSLSTKTDGLKLYA